MSITLKPPADLNGLTGNQNKKVFLAGTIDMGKAENWRRLIEDNFRGEPIIFLNPYREEWNSNWEQNIENPEFRSQVEWELAGMEMADLIIMYFLPGSYSPVTLLELGLNALNSKLVVCCPAGFWRKGNVDIVCKKYKIRVVDKLEDLCGIIRKLI